MSEFIPYNFIKVSLIESKGSNNFRIVNDPPNSRLTRDIVRQTGNSQGNSVTWQTDKVGFCDKERLLKYKTLSVACN